MPEVLLPLNVPVSATASTGNNPPTRILVIDDEAGIRESLEVLLGLEGYAPSTAPDGEAGLRMLELENFDLVLLDLALQGIDIDVGGTDTLRQHGIPFGQRAHRIGELRFRKPAHFGHHARNILQIGVEGLG